MPQRDVNAIFEALGSDRAWSCTITHAAVSLGGTMRRGTYWVSALFAACLPAIAGQAQAHLSPECADAKAGERPACADSAVVQLDREISDSLAEALRSVGQAGKNALHRDQAIFARARASVVQKGDQDLSLMLEMRRDFLNAIRSVKNDAWTGSWANAFGTIEILARSGGAYHVRMHAADPVSGSWVCEFEDSAVIAPRNIAMIVGAESAADDGGGPNEGWTLAFRIAGDILMVEPLRPKGRDGKIPFCTHGGNVSGNFFAQDNPLAARKTAQQQ